MCDYDDDDWGEHLNEIHNKGQEDGSKGICEPPNGNLDRLLASSDEEDRMIEEYNAYMQGCRNGLDMRD